MTKTVLDLTPEELESYRPAIVIRMRQKNLDAQTEKRWRQARRLALKATNLLRHEFGAEKVLLFGSAVHRSWFTLWSDIDLAAFDIAPGRFFAAVAAVTGLSPDFKIDLVDPETCSASLRSVIERDGVEL